MKIIISALIGLNIIQSLFSQNHWESLVVESNEWRYLPAVSEPDPSWNQPSFNDSSWAKGIGGFGFADDDDATIISDVSSVYLRKVITINDPSLINKLLLDIDYDDAFVFYLNGSEVSHSSNVFQIPLAFDDQIFRGYEAVMYQGMSPERYELDTSLLIQGENLIAVQILNRQSSRNNDMSARVFVNAEINSSDTLYQPTPVWFTPPVSYDQSNLPLILIDTYGNNIPDEPKITAWMKVINGPDSINSIYDTTFEFNGYIGIEMRGNTSASLYEKKSFTFETRTDSGANLNISLLGLPEENDWVLQGPYSDKTMMRNAVAYHLGNKMGYWSPHTRFCEVFINDEYRGVYVLTEKIKIDKNRVDIAKILPVDNSGDELTGGYILSIDRNNPGSWISPFYGRTGTSKEYITYVDPKYDELTTQQQNYIKEYVSAFEYALAGDNFKDTVTGYRKYIDVLSFVDFFLMTELARNLDGYRCSVYMHKDKNSKGGKLKMTPLWDYDLCFGNGDFMQADNPVGWVDDGIGNGDGYEPVFWWNRLLQDPYFVQMTKNRWNELRMDEFSAEKVFYAIDSCATILSEAIPRNFQKFDILSITVWPNAYAGGSYENEIIYLKQWFTDRFAWLDASIATITRSYLPIKEVNPVGVNPINLISQDMQLEVYPNPFNNKINFNIHLKNKASVEIVINDLIGEMAWKTSKECLAGLNEINIEAEEFKHNGKFFIYNVLINGEKVVSGKLIKK